MKQRIIGFDLARAYSIFGMYIVNCNIVFGNHKDNIFDGTFLSLFRGNSNTVFVMLAGMGTTLMTNRGTDYTIDDKRRLRSLIKKRALFLIVMGFNTQLMVACRHIALLRQLHAYCGFDTFCRQKILFICSMVSNCYFPFITIGNSIPNRLEF